MNDDGSIHAESLVPMEYYGACPDVGDVVYEEMLDTPRCYSVQRRFLINIPGCPNAWAIIVRKIEVPPSLTKLVEEWKEDDAAAAAVHKEDEEEQANDLALKEFNEKLAALRAKQHASPAKRAKKAATDSGKKSPRPKPKRSPKV